MAATYGDMISIHFGDQALIEVSDLLGADRVHALDVELTWGSVLAQHIEMNDLHAVYIADDVCVLLGEGARLGVDILDTMEEASLPDEFRGEK